MGALLVVLLNLLALSGAAYASSVGSALPVGATPVVGGGAAQAGSSAVQSAVAPVTKTVAQTVEKTTAPVTEAGSKDVSTVAAPASSAVTQSAGKVATPVLDATTQTVRKTAAPVLNTAAQTIRQTAAPVVETARQSVGDTVAPVVKTAAPVLNTTEQTLVKAAAPVLQTAAHTIGDATAPVLQTATHTIGDAPAPVGKPITLTVADKALSKPPVTATQEPSNAPYSVATNTTPSITPPSSRVPLSGLMPTPRVPQGISANVAGLLLRSASTLPAQLAQVGSAMESFATFAASPAGEAGRRAGTPSASSIPLAPSPLPGGSSGAMASAAGVAFSIFLTLAGLLLMGGLAAMRLLRLASEPRRSAPFVLIPERPG